MGYTIIFIEMADITSWKVPKLNTYLRTRTIIYSGKRRNDLARLVGACIALNLLEENCQLDSTDDVNLQLHN